MLQLVPPKHSETTLPNWHYQHLSFLLYLFISREPTFEPLTMSPSRVETIVNEAEGKQFENRLHPEDIELSEAMATSAAALSYHMGRYDIAFEVFDDLQVILGLGFGKSIVAEKKKWTRPCFKVGRIHETCWSLKRSIFCVQSTWHSCTINIAV